MKQAAPPRGDGADPDATATSRAQEVAAAGSDALAVPAELPRIRLAATPDAGDTDLRLQERLGGGGMGVVWLAHQRSLGREVAVKLNACDDPRANDALLHEGRITGGLEHPNIVPIHGLARDERGAPVLVMRRVTGVSWRALLDDPDHPDWAHVTRHFGRHPRERHLRILLQVCNALSYAHESGIVHLDVKPRNVMVGRYGEVYLVDWGVALFIADQPEPARRRRLGTPAYMAPELADPSLGRVGVFTDVYLLGATLYRALAGRPPHGPPGAHATPRPAPPPLPPDVPDELAAIVERAMRPMPEARYQSVDDFRQALAEHLEHHAALALTEEAEHALDRVVALQAAPAPDAAALGAAAAHAQLLFRLALRQWADNPRARAGLDRLHAAWCAIEADAGHLEAAEALLAAMETPPPALSARLTALRQARAEREATRRAMDRLLRRLALVAPRRLVLALLTPLALLLGGFVVWRATQAPPTLGSYTPSLVAGAASLAALLVVYAVFRRPLGHSEPMRRLVITLIVMMAALVANRLLGLRHVGNVQLTLAVDAVLVAAGSAIGALAIHRVFAPAAILFTGAAVAGAIWLPAAPQLFNVSGLVATLWGILILTRQAARRPPPADDEA